VNVFQSEVAVNWDISRVPAFLVNKSRHLVNLSHNAVREGIHTQNNGDKQICQVISRLPKLGRSQCSRFVLGDPNALLQGRPIFDVLGTIAKRSLMSFNAADPRITDAVEEQKLQK
jgi:hypothetical protein